MHRKITAALISSLMILGGCSLGGKPEAEQAPQAEQVEEKKEAEEEKVERPESQDIADYAAGEFYLDGQKCKLGETVLDDLLEATGYETDEDLKAKLDGPTSIPVWDPAQQEEMVLTVDLPRSNFIEYTRVGEGVVVGFEADLGSAQADSFPDVRIANARLGYPDSAVFDAIGSPTHEEIGANDPGAQDSSVYEYHVLGLAMSFRSSGGIITGMSMGFDEMAASKQPSMEFLETNAALRTAQAKAIDAHDVSIYGTPVVIGETTAGAIASIREWAPSVPGSSPDDMVEPGSELEVAFKLPGADGLATRIAALVRNTGTEPVPARDLPVISVSLADADAAMIASRNGQIAYEACMPDLRIDGFGVDSAREQLADAFGGFAVRDEYVPAANSLYAFRYARGGAGGTGSSVSVEFWTMPTEDRQVIVKQFGVQTS